MPSSRITSLCWKGWSSHLLRVLEQKGIPGIYVPGTYTNIFFLISVWWDIRTSSFFHSRAFFLRVNRLFHNHIIRTCPMYHAACKVEFEPFTRSYSQLTFFNFLLKLNETVNQDKIREEPENRKAEGAKRPSPFLSPFFAFRQKSLFIAGRTSIGCQK